MCQSRLFIILLVLFVICSAVELDPTPPVNFKYTPKRYMVEVCKGDSHKCSFECTGVLVNGYREFSILTRLSCVIKHQRGQYQLVMKDEKNERHSRYIDAILEHPYYQKNRRAYDVALLRPWGRFQHNYAKPINLPKMDALIYCEMYMFDISNQIVSQDLQMFGLLQCDNLTNNNERTFICGSRHVDWCPDRDYIAECNGFLFGISVDEAGHCGKTKPYRMYDIDMFVWWIKRNELLQYAGAITFRRIDLSNLIYTIIIILLSFLLN